MRNKMVLDQIKELTEALNKAKTDKEMTEILDQRLDFINEYIGIGGRKRRRHQ